MFEGPVYDGWETTWHIDLDIEHGTGPRSTRIVEIVEDNGKTAVFKQTVFFMEDFDSVGEDVGAEIGSCRVKKTYLYEEPIFTISSEDEWMELRN